MTKSQLTIQEYLSEVGKLECTSPWVEVPQSLINTFADATYDHQFIHVDVERAKSESPFGGTIAHGFLSLSLLSHFAAESLPGIENRAMGINYGFEKIRFLNPVPSGARLRGHFKLLDAQMRKPGEYLSRFECSVEIESHDKPALVADWLSLTIMNKE